METKIEAVAQPEIIAAWIVAAKAVIKSNVEASKAFRRVIQKVRFNPDGSKDPSTGPERSKLENTRRELGRVTLMMLVFVAAMQGKRLLGGVFATAGSHDPAWYVRAAIYELSRQKNGRVPAGLNVYDLMRRMDPSLKVWAKASLDPVADVPQIQWLLPRLEEEQAQHTATAAE